MKKLVSLLLAIVMMMSLAVSASAVSFTGDGSKNVGAEFVEGQISDTGTIYSVKLEWTSLNNLVYTEGNVTYRWDATNHKYVVDSTTDSVWSGGNFEVKITNNSNAAITATADYNDTTTDSLTTAMTWTNQTATLKSAADGITNYVGTGAATTATLSGAVKVTEGTISEDTANVGTISITIEQVG